ncbi:uncharacterized protein F4807DRAFT_467134 [Annulohypoxylon truncatum]|uniref:uncharacterized protein n=1 Tax=Annulohypoxylon truncatum TaxID=327061 RepID=UPI002008B6B5|nr:uncharacterized protein F4807DRAFT_467134 [Annulohypoxylon truncatum]KAI1210346.1 hypothetical protein F4807DRAFT_467134 [Annulohypoxylon truncatum]
MHPSVAGSGFSLFSTSPITSTTTITSTSAATAAIPDRRPSTASRGPVSTHGSPSENGESGRPHKRGAPLPPPRPCSSSHDDGCGLSPDSAGGGGDGGPVEDQRTKKRRLGAGSRGVANLTPEQLAKKRANDREAQRAIRERTKNQIETLERRIHELTSQRPYQELQAVIRAKEAVEAENAEIKSRLASIMSMIQPILSNQQVEGAYNTPPLSNFANVTPAQPTQRSPSLPTTATYNASTPMSAASPASTMADQSSSWQAQAQAQAPHPHPSPHFAQVKMLNQQRHELLHGLDLGAGEQLKLDFLLDPSARVSRMQTGVDGPQDTPEYHHLPMKHDWNANANANSIPSRNGTAIENGVSHHQQQQQRIEYAPQYTPLNPNVDTPTTTPSSWIGRTAPIKNSAPTCPLDNLLLDFLSERRQRAHEGVPAREVVGPRYPSVSSLLNPAHSAFSHPLSKVFTDILAAFPGISTLPERVAVLYYMFLVMRWQVSPTRENYELLPDFARPTPAQLRTPHPAWVDHLPFPAMRERLASAPVSASASATSEEGGQGGQAQGPIPFENFFIPFTTTISLNWPYEGTDALLRSPAGGELLINPVFERHLRRFENWTLGDAFDAAFPRLRGTYNLKVGTRTREMGGGG